MASSEPAKSRLPDLPRGRGKSDSPFAVSFGDLQNVLKLRTNFNVNDKLKLNVGADFNCQYKSFEPSANLQYEVVAKDKHVGTLQATTQSIALQKAVSVTLLREKPSRTLFGRKVTGRGVSCKVVGTVGYGFNGRPIVGVNIGSVKPTFLVAGAAVAMVALDKTVSGTWRGPEGLSRKLPVLEGASLAQGEVGLSVKKTKEGIALNVSNLNGLLTL